MAGGSSVAQKLKSVFVDYFKLKFDVLKIEQAEKAAATTSKLIAFLIIGFFFALTYFFGMILLGIYLSNEFHSYFEGFRVIFLLHFIPFILLLLLKRWLIIKPIFNKIMASVLRD